MSEVVRQGASRLSLIAVGDLLLGDSAITVSHGFFSRYPDGIHTRAESLRHLLSPADIVFGNLECTLSRHGHHAGSWVSEQMRGTPIYVADLRRAGFDVLSVANNHAVQHGAAAFHETVRLLEEAGISVCGLRGTDGWLARPVMLSRAGRSVGILGYCLRPRQYDADRDPPFAEGEPAAMRRDVARLSELVDSVVVSLHWGEEFVHLPSRAEVELATSLIDSGAALLIGHHPHVTRPIQAYGGAIIAYSLGNFIADMIWQPELREGQVLRCRLEAGRVAGAEVDRVRIGDDYMPVRTSREEVAEGVAALEPGAYAAAVRTTVSRQRRHAYTFVLSRLFAYRASVIRQLVFATVRNKVHGLREHLLG